MPRNPDNPRFWTPERERRLAELRAKGLTYRRIAEEIGDGCNKNMAIGRAHRLKLSNNRPSDRPAPVPEPPPPEPVVVGPRPDPEHPTRCVTPGCRGTRQKNLTGLCAECTKDRLARQGRARAGTFEIRTSP